MIRTLLEHRARLPRLGRIRLGVKRVAASGASYPTEVSHFVLPPELQAILGERPTVIPVLFPVDDVARVLTGDYSIYGRGPTGPGLLLRRCDGQRFTEWPRAGGEVAGPCRKVEPFRPCPDACHAAALLHVIVLDGPLGIWQVVLGGEQRIADIAMELEMMKHAFGRLTNIRFELVREAATRIVRTATGERLAKTGWPVHVRVRSVSAREALASSGQRVLALPEGPEAPEEDEDEGVAEPGNGEPHLESAPRDASAASKPSTTSAPFSVSAPPQPELGSVPGHPSAAQPHPWSAPIHPSAQPSLSSAPEPQSAPVPGEWDVSMCYAAAAKLGVSRRAYDVALERWYGRYPEGLPQEYVDAEMRRFLQAGADPARHAELRALLLAPLRAGGGGGK